MALSLHDGLCRHSSQTQVPGHRRCPSNRKYKQALQYRYRIDALTPLLFLCLSLLTYGGGSGGGLSLTTINAFVIKTSSVPRSSSLLHHRSRSSLSSRCRPTILPNLRTTTTTTTNNNNNGQRLDTYLFSSSSTTTTITTTTPPLSSKKTYRVQILMSDTGGGHRASANALRDAFNELYPPTGGGPTIECDIVDIYTEYGPCFPYDSYVPIYQIMQANPILWEILFKFSATDFGLMFNEFMLELFCFEPFLECIKRSIDQDDTRRADMVVSVHPLTQDIPLKVLNYLDSDGKTRENDGTRKTPFVTVVTDLGSAHPAWFNPSVDRCFVPSDALDHEAQERGLKPHQITKHGLPIRKGFWASTGTKPTGGGAHNKNGAAVGGGDGILGTLRNLLGGDGQGGKLTTPSPFTTTISSTNTRESLGLIPDIPTILIVGGGDGMGGIVEQARAVADRLGADAAAAGSEGEGRPRGTSYQMVVVCGKNADAKDRLTSMVEKGKKEGGGGWSERGVLVKVKGFVNNMDEFMRASDVIITKAGPGTIAEASICGLPCILSSFLPGQEEGNIPFVKDAGFGSYNDDPKGIADTVSKWLSSPDRLTNMKENALRAARPTATIDIAKDLAEMLFALV